jgi:predicted nuclease with TOPRIM domain
MKNEENIKSFTLKVYPSEEERFRKIVEGMDDIDTLRDGLTKLMDNYEFPKTVQVDNPELIKKNQDLQDEIDEILEANKNLVAQVEYLESKLKSLDDEKAQRPDNIFEVEVHPVAFHFLKEMAEKTQETPGDILTDLFIRDLQNPRANNLPYIVASSEIKAKLEEYKKAHPEEYQRKED